MGVRPFFRGVLQNTTMFPIYIDRRPAFVPRITIIINCTVGQACFSPKHESRCFPQSGGVRVPRPAPKTATSPWGNVKFKEKHHAKTPILVKACLYTAKEVKFQSLTASLSQMAGPRSEKLEKSSRLRMRWKSFCERWPQGIGATIEKSIYIYI